MKLATTTTDFARYGTFEDCVRWIHEAGFKYLDFGVANREFLRDDGWEKRTKMLNDYAGSLGMKFIQMHSPAGNPMDPAKQEDLIAITERSIRIAALMGIPQTVVHVGTWDGITMDEFYKGNYGFFRRLFPVMEETGVNVLIENSTRVNVPPEKRPYIYSGEDMREFLRHMDHPLMHALWDTGHGNVDGPQYENIVTLGKELYGIHVHDNSGWADEHAIPYMGTLSLDALMHGLLDIDYQGYFTFEAVNAIEYKNGQNRIYKWEDDRRLRHPTAELQLLAEKLLYGVGKHALSAYGVFEE